MGRFVNPDNSGFKAALDTEIYVDKTGLVRYTNKVLNTKLAYICNSRPRRFGKTTTADMLAAYYSRGCDSEAMFSSLEIGEDPDFRKHLNKYDVIRFDVQECISSAGGAEKVLSYISDKVIGELDECYPSVIAPGEHTLKEVLGEINKHTRKKYIFIIDEWDVLIRDDKNVSIQKSYIEFLRGLFKGSESTGYIALAYLTGILPIIKEKTQSALNNFEEYTMLDPGPLAQYVGFTEEEVRALCKTYSRDFDEVRRWYDGYRLGGYHVYNPRAVVSVMLSGRFKSYWSETASYDTVIDLIGLNYDGLKGSVIEMLSGSEVSVNTGKFKNDPQKVRSRDDVLTYLIHLGYSAFDEDESMVFIPNEEVRQEMAKAVEDSSWDEVVLFYKESDEILKATLAGNCDAVASALERVHNTYTSVIQYNDENSLSSVLTIAYLSSMRYYFKPRREMASGKGYVDFVYLPRPKYLAEYPALVIELKWDRSAEGAIRQIKERKYTESIEEYAGNILLVEINYDKDTKMHVCTIEKIVK